LVRQAREIAAPAVPRPAARPQQRAPQPSNVVEEFVALTPRPLFDAAENMQVVRVRLPRPSLVRFGVAPDESWPERVQADLLVGRDGTAHAVRFVSTTR
jgi:hypothetical protein